MLQPMDRIKRVFGLSVDNRFVSKLITTQYDDLTFSEDGRMVHPEMEEILQLIAAMEHFSEDANKRMEKLDMPTLSSDAQKEMDDVIKRIAETAKKSEGQEEGGFGKAIVSFKNRLVERSKGNTRERFAAVYKACVETAVALGEQVKAEKEYLQNFGELEVAMSSGTILAAEVRKRQTKRTEDAAGRMSDAAARLEGANPESDDYAQVRHDAMMAQRAFDLENKRKLFATELFSKMSHAHDFASMLAVSLAQKTLTKEGLWIAMSNSLATQQATFSMAQANLSSMESLNEGAKMKSTLDRGNSSVIQSIGSMSTQLQQRVTMIAHSGGPSTQDLQLLGKSIMETQRTIAPMRQKLIEQGAADAQRCHQATLAFQRDIRSVAVENAQRSLGHQKDKRDGLSLSHEEQSIIDVDAVEVRETVPASVDTPEAPRQRRAGP